MVTGGGGGGGLGLGVVVVVVVVPWHVFSFRTVDLIFKIFLIFCFREKKTHQSLPQQV